ncbi:MAG: hypothetical protein JXR83_04525, partial [Deltaproteobacteria bacterium]|nr:hypothetical protein [Deltaproteobacteria bacterium]
IRNDNAYNPASPDDAQHTTQITIIDPTDKVHLHGGGAINHNINVTVIREDRGERLASAVVFAGNKAAVLDQYDKGVTDGNGMTVISGSGVATGPVTLTIGAPGYETQTLIGLNAQDVTVLLARKVPEPPTPTFGVISGGVTGWANAQFPSGADQNRYFRVAQIYASDENPNTPNVPPGVEAWAMERGTCNLTLFDGTPALVDGSYSLNSFPGTHAVLAIVFYWDSYDGVCGNNPVWTAAGCPAPNNACEGWLSGYIGAVFGIRTDITVPEGDGNVGDQNINLNHSMFDYSTSFSNNPTVAGANYTAYTADAYLSVGSSGSFTFMAAVKGDPQGISFGPVPALVQGWSYTVHGYVGMPILDGTGNIVDFTLPVTHSFQRGLTNVTPPRLTNWIYFLNNLSYTKPANTEGRFTFGRTGGASVNDDGFTAIGVFHVDTTSVIPLWSVLAAGDRQTIELPDLTGETGIDNIPTGNHKFSALQAKVPSFNFNELVADDRTSLNWSAAVQSAPMDLTR